MNRKPTLLEGLSRSDAIHHLTGGYGQMAVDLVAEGWSPFLLVLKFRHIGGRRDAVIEQMHRGAAQAYERLLTRIWRRPYAPSRRALLPRWILIADLPVPKREKASLRDLLPNDGLHLQGVAVMPPGGRLTDDLDQHLARAGERYCPKDGPLAALHATPIVRNLDYVHRYNFKTLARGRANLDDILVLPRSSAEIESKPRPAAEPWHPLVRSTA